MLVGNFSLSAKLFLDAISTSTCFELMDYVMSVEYTVWIYILVLDRSALHKEVVKGSEILEVLYQCHYVANYPYNCQYA